MKRALIYLDPDAVGDALELTEVVDEMYGPGACETTGVGVAAAGERGESGDLGMTPITGIDRHIRIAHERIGPYDIEHLVRCIADLHDEYRFDAILILATTVGRMLAPRLAMRLHVGLVADVTEIRRNGDEIRLVRPAFSGRMLASIVCRGEGMLMASVRPNAFVRRRRSDTIPETRTYVPDRIPSHRVREVARRVKTERYDIRESDVLVAGGGGILNHFEKLDALAAELGGMVAASRRVVDGGKAPRAIQVGQSGKTVSPRLYLALGVSGSIQHVVGLRRAEFIIAVNKDRHAPMCALADIVVEGDAREFVERMVEKIGGARAVPPDAPHTNTSHGRRRR